MSPDRKDDASDKDDAKPAEGDDGGFDEAATSIHGMDVDDAEGFDDEATVISQENDPPPSADDAAGFDEDAETVVDDSPPGHESSDDTPANGDS